MAEVKFKPNIYPIMYWGLMFGLIAGFVLFAIFMLSRYITTIWFPVFLAGVIWGGYRNYRKQKKVWQESANPPAGQARRPNEATGAVEEVKEAARDIVAAARDMMSEQAETTAAPDETDQSHSNLPPA
ncbi:MAG: hypothetical protein ABIH36_03545 [bacterium]